MICIWQENALCTGMVPNAGVSLEGRPGQELWLGQKMAWHTLTPKVMVKALA